MWESLDQRKFPRLKIRCDIFVRDQFSSFTLSTRTENIGAGGVCIILDRALARFSNVSLKIDLNDSREVIECPGKVVWCIPRRTFREGRPRDEFDTGIEFVNLPSKYQDRIRGLILSHSSSGQSQ